MKMAADSICQEAEVCLNGLRGERKNAEDRNDIKKNQIFR